MDLYQKKLLITGGAGFIGSHVVRFFTMNYPEYSIVNLDSLTYAGNLENLTSVERLPNYRFVKVDILDEKAIASLFEKERFDGVIHLAAASHVDRSLKEPNKFIETNIAGTHHLLNTAWKCWGDDNQKLFYHISTDEVYGSAKEGERFTEKTVICPNSPYSASKASSDHFVHAYHHSYNLPTVISRCSNNYGPNQFPEKLIPLIIQHCIDGDPLPVYGKGNNIRDWLYVEDHVHAIDTIFHQGKKGEVYNIGGGNEWQNIKLVTLLCTLVDNQLGNPEGTSSNRITFVKDRPGHDLRYAVDFSKIQNTLGWKPRHSFEKSLEETVSWYLANPKWLQRIASGIYRNYYETVYENKKNYFL